MHHQGGYPRVAAFFLALPIDCVRQHSRRHWVFAVRQTDLGPRFCALRARTSPDDSDYSVLLAAGSAAVTARFATQASKALASSGLLIR